jgi:hypothetical protein
MIKVRQHTPTAVAIAVFIGVSFSMEVQSMHLNARFSRRERKLYRENKLRFRNFSDSFDPYIHGNS